MNIADMNIADNLLTVTSNNKTMKKNVPKVYEAGQMSIIKSKAYGSGTLTGCLDEPIFSLSFSFPGGAAKIVFTSESGETQEIIYSHSTGAVPGGVTFNDGKVIAEDSLGNVIDITNTSVGEQIKALRTYAGTTYVTSDYGVSVGYYKDVRQARYEEGEKVGKDSEKAKIDYNFKRSKKAVLMRGGEISMDAEIDALPEAIANIPIDASLAFYEDKEIAYQKIVPEGAEEYALLKQLGGMTYIDDATNTLRDSKVTEIVSHGKNLLSNDVMDVTKWKVEVNYAYYNLKLLDGWYCLSAKLSEGYPSLGLYIQKSENGGQSYISSSERNFYDGRGYIGTGYFITGKGVERGSLWFKVDNKAGIVYRFQFYAPTQEKLNYIYDMQIEMVELAQEPSESYPPETHAPATEYTPYREPITYPIPEEMQELEGYGQGVINDLTQEVYTNAVDFKNKQYTQQAERLVLDGVTVKAPYGDDTSSGKWRYYVYASYALLSEKALKIANFDGLVNISGKMLILTPNNQDLNSAAKFNKWLTEMYNNGTPVEVVYAIQNPIVSDISNELADFDNFLSVEGGGTLEFVNEHSNAVPSTVKYTTKVGN